MSTHMLTHALPNKLMLASYIRKYLIANTQEF